jgi:hypothetical protein
MGVGGWSGERTSWGFDFADSDGFGGFVRLELRPDLGVAWYWAYLVGPEVGLVVVRDHDVPLPRRAESLVVRADGLWAELVCETPDEHWSIGLEAFGVRLDDPADAFHGEVGERLAIGFDLEWEVTDGSEGPDRSPAEARAGTVFGEVLLGRDRIAFEGAGVFRHERGEHAWMTTAGVTAELDAAGLPRTLLIGVEGGGTEVEVLGVAAIPIEGPPHDGGATHRELVRALGRWTDDDGATKVGWVDLVEQR